MATTTWKAIRDNYLAPGIGRIVILTPNVIAEPKFERAIPSTPLREQALRNPTSTLLRKCEMVTTGETVHLGTRGSGQVEIIQPGELLVAYPLNLADYGEGDLDDVEHVMRTDASQLRDTLFSPSGYIPGQNACFVEIAAPEKFEKVWLLPLRLEVHFYEAESL